MKGTIRDELLSSLALLAALFVDSVLGKPFVKNPKEAEINRTKG